MNKSSSPNSIPVSAIELQKMHGNPKTVIRYIPNKSPNHRPTLNGKTIILKSALSSAKDMKTVFKNITLSAVKPIRPKSVAVLTAKTEKASTVAAPANKVDTVVQSITCSPKNTYLRNARDALSPSRTVPVLISEPTATTVASVSTTEYRELSAALLKIKDTAFVNRVMAAINGKCASKPEVEVSATLCSQCGSFQTGSTALMPFVSVATQTLELDFQKLNAMIEPMIKRVQQRKRKRVIPHAVKTAELVDDGCDGTADMTKPSSELPDIKHIVKNGSDAVRIQPLVTPVVPLLETPATSSASIKTSPPLSPSSAVVASNNDIFFGSGLLSKPHSVNNSYANSPAQTPGRSNDSLFDSQLSGYPTDDFLESFFSDKLDAKLDRSNEYTVVERIKQTFSQELRSHRFDPESGLLPIHVAALNGEHKRLMRLVKIFKVLNIDLNDQRLRAHDVDVNGECLENSILHFAVDSVAPDALTIVQHLLANGADPLQCNRHDDNVLHYAAQHTDNPAIFDALLTHLEKVAEQQPPRMLFTALAAVNQDGQALIHLIVSNRKFDFMVALLATIDRSLLQALTSTAPDQLEIDGPSQAKKAMLMQMQPPTPRSAAALCEHIDGFEQYAIDFGRLIDPQKATMLNQPDPKTGRTALLRAILQCDAELVLLLLAHHADPRLADLAGVDCAAACVGIADEPVSPTPVSKTAVNMMVVYVEKVWNMRMLMDGGSTRARVLLRPATRADSGNGGEHGLVPLSSSVIRMSAVDQASLLASIQRPKRPYKKRKMNTEKK